jgi:hypothetical protein
MVLWGRMSAECQQSLPQRRLGKAAEDPSGFWWRHRLGRGEAPGERLGETGERGVRGRRHAAWWGFASNVLGAGGVGCGRRWSALVACCQAGTPPLSMSRSSTRGSGTGGTGRGLLFSRRGEASGTVAGRRSEGIASVYRVLAARVRQLEISSRPPQELFIKLGTASNGLIDVPPPGSGFGLFAAELDGGEHREVCFGEVVFFGVLGQ